MSAMQGGPTRNVTVGITLVAVAVLTVVLADRPILDTDYFWHLRTGALIAETGRVPMVDPYSYSAPGARWVDLHWLFQVALFQLFQLGGHEANRTAGFVLGCAIVAVSALSLWRRDRPAVCGLALTLLVVAACIRFLVRPDTVSLLLTAIVLALLRRDERGSDRWVFAIVPVQLLWANLHGLQAVGLALIAIALLSEVAAPWVAAAHPMRRDRVRRLSIVLALSVVAAVMNPNGLDGALFPLRQLAMINPVASSGVFDRTIDELRSPLAVLNVHSAWAIAAFALLAMLTVASLYLDRNHVSLFDALVCFAFLILAFSASRNVALFAVVAAPIFVSHWSSWLDETSRFSPAQQRQYGAATIACLVLATGFVTVTTVARGDGPLGSSSPALAAFWFPERAVDWIERHRAPGPLYARMGDGGFLIWRLWPEQRVLVDGRLEVYGETLYEDLEVTGEGGPDTFQRLDARYRFGTALIHFGLFREPTLFIWLDENPEWRLVHLDEVAAVFVRTEVAEAENWPAVNVDSPLLFEPLDAQQRHPLDLWRRRSRIAIFAGLGRLAAARELLDETRSLYPDPELDALRARLMAASPPGS